MLLKQRPIETFVLAKIEKLIILTFMMISRHWLLIDRLVSLSMTFLSIYFMYWVTCIHYSLWLIIIFELFTTVTVTNGIAIHHTTQNQTNQYNLHLCASKFYSMWQWGMLTSCMLTYMTNASRGTKHEKKKRAYNWIRGKTWRCQWQGAGRTIFRPMVVEKVTWPTTNLHIHIKSKVSLHAN